MTPETGLAVGFVVLGGCFLVLSLCYGVPEKRFLTTITGTLHSYERTRSGSRGRYKAEFRIDGSQHVFQYSEKAGDIDFVMQELSEANGKTVEVEYEVDFDFDSGNTELITVYSLTVDGAVIRDYGQVRDAWRSSDRIGETAGWAMILFGLLLAWHERISIHVKRLR